MFQHIAACVKIAYAISGPSCFFFVCFDPVARSPCILQKRKKATLVKQYLTEKPKNMLEKHGVSSSGWVEETGIKVSVGQQHSNTSC
jgi:hypothetical protein